MSAGSKKRGMPDISAVEHRLLPLKRFALAAALILLLWSAFLETSFFFSGFQEMLNNSVSALTLTLLLVMLIESSKFYLGAYAFRFMVQGWLKEGWSYRLAFLIVLPLCVAVYFGSIYLNVKGAPKVASFFTHKTQNIELEPLDSINRYYDQRQASLKAEKETAQTIRHRGKITYHATLLLTKLQDQAMSIELQRDSALARAQRRNERVLAQSVQSPRDWGKWLSKLGGYGETMTLFFLFFMEVYDKARQENNNVQTTTSPRKKRRQKKRQKRAAQPSPEMAGTRVWYNDKPYPPSRFRDWLAKVERRSKDSATASARQRNRHRYSEMQIAWNNYQRQSRFRAH
jgi:hypothetical protein